MAAAAAQPVEGRADVDRSPRGEEATPRRRAVPCAPGTFVMSCLPVSDDDRIPTRATAVRSHRVEVVVEARRRVRMQSVAKLMASWVAGSQELANSRLTGGGLQEQQFA